MKPYLKWLVLKGDLDGSEKDLELDEKSVAHPFMPLAFGYQSTGRALAGLWIGGEPLHSQLGDGDAMFGTEGALIKVPRKSQKIYPARRDFRLGAQDLSTAANAVCLAILGLLYVDDAQPGPQPGPTMQWVNLYGSAAGNGTVQLAEAIDFPFEPVAITYVATGRAEVILSADDAPFNNVAGDLAAMFGTLGVPVVIPAEARRVYDGKTTFNAEVTDLSGATNVVTVSLLGNQYKI